MGKDILILIRKKNIVTREQISTLTTIFLPLLGASAFSLFLGLIDFEDNTSISIRELSFKFGNNSSDILDNLEILKRYNLVKIVSDLNERQVTINPIKTFEDYLGDDDIRDELLELNPNFLEQIKNESKPYKNRKTLIEDIDKTEYKVLSSLKKSPYSNFSSKYNPTSKQEIELADKILNNFNDKGIDVEVANLIINKLYDSGYDQFIPSVKLYDKVIKDIQKSGHSEVIDILNFLKTKDYEKKYDIKKDESKDVYNIDNNPLTTDEDIERLIKNVYKNSAPKLIEYTPKTPEEYMIYGDYLYYMENPDEVLDGYIPNLVFENGNLVSFEFKEHTNSHPLKTNYSRIESFSTSPIIKEASLLSFNTFSSERKLALKEMLMFLLDVKNDNVDKGFLLRGKSSTGKTYLLSALAKELAVLKKRVVFLYYSDLNRIMNSMRFDKNLESRIDVLSNCDFLIIDGFAATKVSSWFRDDCLIPILNHRLINNKVTFFATSVVDDNIFERKFNNEGFEFDIASGITTMVKKLTKTLYLSHKYNS